MRAEEVIRVGHGGARDGEEMGILRYSMLLIKKIVTISLSS